MYYASKNWDYNVAWIDTSPNIKEMESISTRGYFLKKTQTLIQETIFN